MNANKSMRKEHTSGFDVQPFTISTLLPMDPFLALNRH